jgi:hypothetical protein
MGARWRGGVRRGRTSHEKGTGKRKNPENRLVFVFIDISIPVFDPKRYGRTREQFLEQMHVLDWEGRFYLGVDALGPLGRRFLPSPFTDFWAGPSLC